MLDKINERIVDGSILGQRCIVRDGYVFTAISEPGNVYDAIVIRNPSDILCFSPRLLNSTHTLDEHIRLVNSLKLEKALVIGTDIDFLPQCPSLKELRILPAENANDNFDFSPLYQMPCIRKLCCITVYGKTEEKTGYIDYSQIQGLERLSIASRGHLNVDKVSTLKECKVSMFTGKHKDLTDLFCSHVLEKLLMITCKNKSLTGIEKSDKIEDIELWYNRSLTDISALAAVSATLKRLSIENCPKIENFSCLAHLRNLEYLELLGNNTLPNLNFLKNMPNLKKFDFSMNVADGDLSPCLMIPYVSSRINRKHYNLKNKDLPPF